MSIIILATISSTQENK
ncbi:hypothetical protein ACYTC7_000617 [Escherichia coli]